jgi:arylsulfatase A-like enzyme
MENRLAVVIVVDGLRASALGTYGNTVSPTPQLDEIAAQSLVVEWLLSNGSNTAKFYEDISASGALRNSAIKRCLLTDDPAVAEQLSEDFEEVLLVEVGVPESAREIDDTHAAQFFALALEQLAARQPLLSEAQSGGLFWIHFSGLRGPWDAPLEMRAELMDEEDPLPPEFVTPPIAEEDVEDVDDLLGYRAAYAAQVAVLDSCLGGFVEALDEITGTTEKMVMLTSSSGFALGEHGCAGAECGRLYSEELHLPWLVMTHETVVPLPRVTGFAQPADISATLDEWFSSDSKSQPGMSLIPYLSGEPGHLRDSVVVSSETGERLIRTRAWQLNVGQSTELYVKPDDRWEANDVASRCGEVVELMLELEKSGQDSELPEQLTNFWR